MNLIMDAVVSNIMSASMESLEEEYVGIYSYHNVSNVTNQDCTDQGQFCIARRSRFPQATVERETSIVHLWSR
jgi:hypothetical protein